MKPELQKMLITILTAALSNFSFLACFDFQRFTELLKWIHEIQHMGDSFRRCIALAFRSVFARPDFVLGFASWPLKSMQAMIELFGGLISEPEFAKSLGVAFVKAYPKFTWMVLKTVQDNTTNDVAVLVEFVPFAFHCFTKGPVQALIEAKFDWVKTFEQTLELIIRFYRRDPSTIFCDTTRLDFLLGYLRTLLHLASQIAGQTDNLTRASEVFARQLAGLEGFLPFSREMEAKLDSEFSEYAVNHRILFILARIAVIFIDNRVFCQETDRKSVV
jgi:hypothetical protein